MLVTDHALNRFKIHHPHASWRAVSSSIHHGVPIHSDIAQQLVGRRAWKTTDRYVLAPDRRGLFVINSFDAVVTYLRFQDSQRAFAEQHWPYPGQPRPDYTDSLEELEPVEDVTEEVEAGLPELRRTTRRRLLIDGGLMGHFGGKEAAYTALTQAQEVSRSRVHYEIPLSPRESFYVIPGPTGEDLVIRGYLYDEEGGKWRVYAQWEDRLF